MTLNGSDLMVFVNNGTKLQSIAYATNHTLSVDMATTDTSTKDNGNGLWQNSEPGMMSWSMTTENLMSDSAQNGHSFNSLFDIMLKRQTVEVAFALQTNNIDYQNKLDTVFEAPSDGWTADTVNQYHGKCYITSLQVTATNGEKATYTATFTGAGNLQKTGNGIQKKTTVNAQGGAAVSPVPTVETATAKKA